MGIEKYVGIGKPEDKNRNTANTDSLQIIDNCFTLYRAYVKTNALLNQDELVNEAMRILAPHSGHLIFGPNDVNINYGDTNEPFYTALLNGTGQKLIVEGRTDCPTLEYVCSFGYKLARGTMVINRGCSVGEEVCGGCIVSEGLCLLLGRSTTKGVIINRGNAALELGCLAKGGIIVNNGYVENIGIGGSASGGLFINYKPTRHIGWGAYGGIFITTHHPDYLFYNATNANGNVIGITPTELAKDNTLADMVEDMRTLSAGDIDVAAVTNLGKKIKIYCRQHYDHR